MLNLIYKVKKVTNMDERRINNRFKLHQMVEINYLNEEIFVNAETVNISIGGLHCKLKNKIDSISELFLMFEIPDDSKNYIIKCYGDVQWQKEEDDGFHVGIKFLDMFKADQEVLKRYFDTLQSE